jgi:hypothetical protein
MSVYVDDHKARYGRMTMCHMLADSDSELRAMAARIGVAERHHQGDHFDICLAKRALAVQAGAVEINKRQAAAMRRRKAETGTMGAPEDAIGWLCSFRKQAL